MIVQLAILSAVLLVVPVLAGSIFSGPGQDGNLTAGSRGDRLLFRWVSGQILLWAGFELICVPLILKEGSFSSVVRLFLLYTAGLLLFSAGLGVWRRKMRNAVLPSSAGSGRKRDGLSVLLWCCAAGLLLLQLVLACVLAYEEGDDAFYVSISTSTVDADTMYCKLPYTGKATLLDIRHALAPFPIWISFLARLSGMEAVSVAQTVLPVVLIVMSYAIYFLIGRRLFPEGSRKLPLFMILLELLVLYGGYSVYSAENFLLVRTAQGKAVLADIILPFLFLLFFLLLEKLQDGRKEGILHWFLTACVMTAGCLCSTQGTQLTGMLVGIVGICTIAVYRKWRLLVPMAACCIIPGGLALLYFMGA